MPEPVAPLPYPDTADPAAPIPDGTVPPMPSEVTSSRAQRPDPGPAPPAGRLSRQVRGDHLPPGIGQVTGIASGLRTRWPHNLGTRGP